jgi:hypothetical protein
VSPTGEIVADPAAASTRLFQRAASGAPGNNLLESRFLTRGPGQVPEHWLRQLALQERIAAGIDKQNQGVFGSRHETTVAKRELADLLREFEMVP